MFFVDLLFALAIGLLLVAIFSAGFRVRGPWTPWWLFLIVIVLAAWAGGLWIQPFGPPLFGVSWLPFLFMGLFVALLLAAAVPPTPPRTRAEAAAQAATEVSAITALGVFFWVLLIGLLVAILSGYMV